MNKQSNTYTIIYSAVMVILVGAALSLVYSALKPLQDDNIKIDKMKQMLTAVHVALENDAEVIATYQKYGVDYMKKLLYKITCKLIDINNRKIEKQIDNDKFLQGLCISNNTLDLNKYSRLMKMIKKRYK